MTICRTKLVTSSHSLTRTTNMHMHTHTAGFTDGTSEGEINHSNRASLSPHKDCHAHCQDANISEPVSLSLYHQLNTLSLSQAVFSVRKMDGGAHLIECDGIGLENRS